MTLFYPSYQVWRPGQGEEENRSHFSMEGDPKSPGKARVSTERLENRGDFCNLPQLWSLSSEASPACFAGLNNGDGPVSETDIFRKASEQLVKYMNSGNRLLHKNFLKQEVVQRFLRLLSSLQGNFPPNIQVCRR